ncbi:response regulator transcription factor [Paenibacillus campi]|uniref:response regulator transcription factor n=1 Tax=Paenibacillus campi TaxID=3106031 RepID=UPI002AFE73A0|nr:response regulator [Paenibacillus sp. SGZ-1014]
MNEPLKVMIADDEFIIREGIRAAVDWDALGMVVVAEAEDGEEALELALAQPVHILLVDMNMPFMDGITVIKRIREQQPDCRFVIITGHDEFRYAQEAIRLGVKDYILKPVDPVHLRKVLAQIATELTGGWQQELYLKQATDQIQRNIPLLREQFCLDWLHGRLSEQEIAHQLQFLGLPVQPPAALLLLRWSGIAEGRPPLQDSDRQLLQFAIGNIAAELLHELPLAVCRDRSGLIVLCLWRQPEHDSAERIVATVRDCISLHIQAHLQPVEGDRMNNESEHGGVGTNNDEANAYPIEQSAHHPMQNAALAIEKQSENMAVVDERQPVIVDRTAQQPFASSDEHMLSIISTVYATAKRMLDGQLLLSPLVRRARAYIQQHYADPQLTLESLADHLQVSPTYLSRTMKRELGQSFIHLLVQVRIQQAAHLLADSDCTILEVAELVGYESQHYFSTAFKKVMGVAPNRYRREKVAH